MEFKLCIILTLLPVGKVIGGIQIQQISQDQEPLGCPSTVYRDVQGFGTGCKYRCNCKTQLCDNITGECQDGCLPGWMGPSCQYRNLANQILRSQQYPTTQIESENASVATDGYVDTCSRTGSAVGQLKQAYWYAELRDLTYIVGFVIKIKQDDAGRFQGFSITVGNSTDGLEICYRHGVNVDGNPTMDINCEKPIVGRYFKIQLPGSEYRSLGLCEVEIYGGRLVSFNKPTYIESTLNYSGTWNSFYAADGRYPKDGEDQDAKTIRTCAATAIFYSANKWWKVDLNNTYSIIAVSFYGRYVNPEQFRSFIVKTGFNDSSLQLFFEDKPTSSNVNAYVPKSKILTWPVDGAIARVERSGNILVVCELEVFADCKYGFCGWECNETCMCSSQTTGTHKILGTCPHGCSSRWTGLSSRCDIECPVDKWGLSCNNTCGNCVESCYAATGNCPGSCKPGWKLPKCSEVCSNGTFGTNCSFTCGYCKNNVYCNRTTGVCEFGCQPGYKQQQCIDKCDNGTFGEDCGKKCGHCLTNDACNHLTGDCPHGCAAGYQVPDCKTMCNSGQYGVNCSTNCGKCRNGETCNYQTGICVNGCEPGWKTGLCNQPCDVGRYGDECNKTCGNCFNDTICSPVNGSCPRGCAAGFYETECKTPCKHGWYGPNCNTTCGDCDNVTNCDTTTGECSNGCLPGWEGSFCKAPCKDGLYGVNCTSSCGNCSNNEPCDKMNGNCRACAPGYQMNNCTETCVIGMYGENCALNCGNCNGTSRCNIVNGVCPFGCSHGYTGMLCIGPTSENMSTIIGAVVGTVTALVVALVVVLIIVKRRHIGQKCTADKKESTFDDLEIMDDRQEKNVRTPTKQSTPILKLDTEQLYTNDVKGIQDKDDKSVNISNLRVMCFSAKRDPSFLYSEFQDLPYGLNGDASEARIAAYKSKNRYKEMYPYNANRVHLPEIPDSPSSTYINASYINGYDQIKKYIAAQGAIQGTINDIWRMIWSENINIIVMLTNCVEVGKMKCEQYWPDEDRLMYGTICTEFVTLEQYSDFVVRTFKCTNESSDASRTVVQFHYTAWPDKDVPDTALSIVQFWRKVREHHLANKKSRTSPWLVHCSAGVGRTGTFIAMDVLYDQGKAEGKVNFKDTVYILREQRLNMVQTKEQYVLLHNIVADILDPIGTVCRSEEFSDVYKQLISNTAKNKQKLFLEYQQVCKATDEFYQDHDEGDTYCNVASNTSGPSTDSKLPENAVKSRNLQINIEDRDRPRLCTAVQGCNDFINAVYMPTYRYRDRLILTQCPMENTVIDFIRMVWDCSITDVVYLEEKLPKDEEAYWPINRERKAVGPFLAELVSEQTIDECCTYRTLRFTLTTNKQQKEIRQYHYHHWPQQKEIPVNTASMLNLISTVDEQFRKEDNSRLVIQCLDGAKRSGLFCVLYSVMERLKMDRQVAVAETVLLARTKRRQIIDNFEQYKYCHDVIDEHLQSSNVYANFA